MSLHVTRSAATILLLAASLAPAFAQTVQSNLTLTIGGDAEQRTIAYDCGEFGQISVAYIDAAPNFFALVPHEDKTLIFVSVLSASGVRYVSGSLEWWTKGSEVTFRDLILAEDAPPLASCSEITETP
jgi:membrane-bound inhibitor of C-type lysozyme